MNIISELRQRIRRDGTATITSEEYDQLQREWITRSGAEEMVSMIRADDTEAIEAAAAILDGEALSLRVCHTTGPLHSDWSGEENARVQYEQWKALVGRLYTIADRMRRGH